MDDLVREELPNGTRRLFARDAQGGEAGFAVIEPGRPGQPAMVEVQVRPEHRSCGLGGRLVRAALDEAGPGAYLWDHENSPASQAIVRRNGLVPVRTLCQMRRWLAYPPLPEPVFPDGVSVRQYQGPQDDEELLRVNNAAFDWHPEQGGWSIEKLRERLAQPWVDPAGIFLARDEQDRLIGFHWTRTHPQTQTEHKLGEVYVLGVDPACHCKGLGKALTLVGLRHLRDQGLAQAKLYVEQTNAPALATYRGLGFTVHAQDVAYVRG
ncbi:mycothiol biosynthesis acetyltransferase [Segniliparus rotundus DSM 44985]|uniref:Mycothiol acetyltransferase n=1 Tax=Segniliparus rotundus (strain ATCC BAA-972 / CDC 1076 / CIP 108378 / DSM 44985 / JCM 13578) TaxID=640132 RepID=MSHD_SEGRD|nr:mycothiol synthase [Segniliparus rotundus]D6ZEJ5.1 RecName: Full=Mycothiol acetyltransferase; Short=MSH acetyltransferase; AltName: Full=Mycothiol synthase [Segniliparus rotundus DSM 44985]ADG99471.1 mycothiol biosynthesis acetyltransferase [Segniliparus rotundus DSM 44985]